MSTGWNHTKCLQTSIFPLLHPNPLLSSLTCFFSIFFSDLNVHTFCERTPKISCLYHIDISELLLFFHFVAVRSSSLKFGKCKNSVFFLFSLSKNVVKRTKREKSAHSKTCVEIKNKCLDSCYSYVLHAIVVWLLLSLSLFCQRYFFNCLTRKPIERLHVKWQWLMCLFTCVHCFLAKDPHWKWSEREISPQFSRS